MLLHCWQASFSVSALRAQSHRQLGLTTVCCQVNSFQRLSLLDQSENIIKHLGSFNNLISFNYGHFMSFWFIAAHEWPKGRILNDMISSYPMRGEGNSCGARRVDSNIEHAHSSYKKNFLTAQLANHRSPQNLQTKCLHQAYIQNILTTYSGLSLEFRAIFQCEETCHSNARIVA